MTASSTGSASASERFRVLVVGINYAPEQTGIAPYTSAAAQHLAAAGHEVTVLTGVPHYPAWRVAPGYHWPLSRTETDGHVTVHRLRHFVPRRQDALRRALYEFTFALRALLRGWSARPDVVIAVVPTLFSGLVAASIAKRSGAQLIVWIQDSMSAAATQSGMRGGGSVAALVGRAERALLKRADSVLVASTAFRRHIEASGADAERVITMANWVHISPSTGDREAVRRQHHWSKDDIIVLHSGNMGLKQDLQRVIEAAAMAGSRSPKVKFVLMGDGSQRNDLEQSALRVPNITLKDPICESDYSDLLAAADILLINERVGVTDMSMPSKVTSYLASGRPVVAAVAWEGVTAKEIVRSGGGIVTQTQTPAGILEAVLSLSNDTARATDLARCGQEYAAAELSAEASLSRLDAVLVGSWSSSAWSQLSRLEAL